MFSKLWKSVRFQIAKVTLLLVPFDRPHTTSHQSSYATMFLSCTISEILQIIYQNLPRSRDSLNTLPSWNNLSRMH